MQNNNNVRDKVGAKEEPCEGVLQCWAGERDKPE
jgi:hypothetical protein